MTNDVAFCDLFFILSVVTERMIGSDGAVMNDEVKILEMRHLVT